MKYSINACIGVRIQASPRAICNIPHKNPDIALAMNPQRKAMINIGIIAKEMEIDGPNLIDGIRSNNIARAAKIAISIIVCKLNFFKKISPLDVF